MMQNHKRKGWNKKASKGGGSAFDVEFIGVAKKHAELEAERIGGGGGVNQTVLEEEVEKLISDEEE